ncbi:unnamed protein product [Danaus chrysippus]|uniref:(African queen) hypothetical protein n=1 Tax=Danaus chrysippus TaxID=151541 RepID=A0A8J2QIE1_9NEOP|nr:unnamed protein product [Danaus chrysippus]
MFCQEPSWSRRCSTETVFSIQGKETDFVQDTSDSEWASEHERGVEYEPVSQSDEEHSLLGGSSDLSDNEIIKTQVIEVSLKEDGGLLMADSEIMSSSSDSELDYHDYWLCAHCRATNNNPLYRYCERCFKVRKNLFPPRPKRRNRKKSDKRAVQGSQPLSPDSGVASTLSQELQPSQLTNTDTLNINSDDRDRVRSDSEVEPEAKRRRVEEEEGEVQPLVKAMSDPAVTLEQAPSELCIMCCSEPKSGVFVHGRIAHICCCYKCALKVWSSVRRCPVCNCKVNNVLRAVVM